MIITESVDNSDAISVTNTLVVDTKETEKLPRFFSALTYASLGLSFIPFVFSLIIIQISRINSIPTILAYFFSTPFHLAALLLIWQQSRQIDMQLPFHPTSWRSIAYISFLAAMWLFAMITAGMGARAFVAGTRTCTTVFSDGHSRSVCYDNHFNRMVGFLISATAIAVLEAFVLCVMAFLCFRSRPRKQTPQVPSPRSSSPSPSPSPKVLSA
ncbi:hypothetical protein GALMADRAFT_248039 [Galerina marginata CBS 339.88]|uniref:MARVEL domain-containing protein n=1 Tax=Galerina marginata (strain CBS 339.88) TaxID=685588 RepID=A0A067T6M1_GALM3|nr:hypothetical protein GALMADRAFT_248039 [Galerina marginata CBS 339.88]